MDFSLKTGTFDSLRSDCLIVTLYADGKLSEAASYVDQDHSAVTHWMGLKDSKLKTGSVAWLPPLPDSNFKRILVSCVSAAKEKTSAQDLRETSRSIIHALRSKNIKNAILSVDADLPVSGKLAATIIADGFTYGMYQYSTTKNKDLKPFNLKRLTLHSETKLGSAWKSGLELGKAAAEGKNAARELGNLPANYCTPTHLAEQALALSSDSMSVKVLDTKQIKKLGMGAFLSVAAGSDEPPKFIIMEYKGAAASTKPTVLVGKGITFDTGGISLKPGQAMDEMKYDMCGAASVMGVMTTLSILQPKINVVGVIAATENMPSGKATKPGDVVTSMSGQTIEILNTDAEGRLVLCDALTYVERYKPKQVIDMATLTGACIVALGNLTNGLFANNQELADKLLQAGASADDKIWQLPIWDDYKKSLDSNFADMANIGGREAGAITAACFLSKYTEKYPWAHLDIAGTAWTSGANKGATGRPVGLLLEFLLGLYSE